MRFGVNAAWMNSHISDYYAIRPAMEALAKRQRQREEAYGIDDALPYGSDPVC